MGLFSGLAPASKFPRMRLVAAALTVSAGSFFACGAGFFACGGLAFAQSPTGPGVGGFWQSTFDDGNPSGWFYFTENNGVAEGRLVKMFKKAGETQTVETCAHCPGAMKGAQMLGLAIVTGMKRHGAKYEDGHVLDPRDGSVYNAQLEVSPDGQKLFLRGYIGMPILGQTRTWTRLPDDAIPAAALPPDPMESGAKKPAAPAKIPAKTL